MTPGRSASIRSSRVGVTLSGAVVAAALALLLGPSAHAAPGDLDGTFGTGGVFAGPAQSVLPGETTRTLGLDHLERPVVGFRSDADASGSDIEVGVMRLTTGGVLDPTFNPNGTTPGLLIAAFSDVDCPDGTADGPAFRALVVTPDHHIVIAALLCSGTSSARVGLMRLDDTGAFDTDFDGDGRLVLTNYQSFLGDIAVDSSEHIYVAGGHCTGGGPSNCFSHNAFVTRITKEGTRDQTFNAGGTIPGIFELVIPSSATYFNGIELLSGDHLVAVGRYSDTTIDALIARLSNAGQLVSTFGPGSTPPGTIRSDLAKPATIGSQAELWGVTSTDDDQGFVVTGQITANAATCPIAKFTATGTLDTTFASTATAPGITALAGAYSCRELLTQPDGKIVAIGWGPRPLGPGMSDTNQVVVGRFDEDGAPDSSFGTNGVVKTVLGNYDVGYDIALQSDGKILAAGVRRLPPNAINPLVVRYRVDDTTPTPTPTGGAQNPTPTPTATPIDQPGEICDNGIDDESDGYRDRADPECPARADGGGQGLSDPKVGGKAIVKCGKAAQGAGAKLGKAKLLHLQRCVHAVFACLQVKPTDAKCLPKAATTCSKQFDALVKDRAKLTDAAGKACTVPALSLDEIKAATGLGFGFEASICLDRGVPALASVADLAACVRAREECAAEQLLAMESPRAAELLTAGGRDPAVDAPCLPPAGPPGSGLPTADRGKAAVKCQGSLFKAASKFTGSKTKVVHACLQAALACVQLKPGDAACLEKLAVTCGKKIAELGKAGGIEAKLVAAIVKDCGGLDAAELTGGDGLGYQAHAAECAAFQAPPLRSAAAIADCVRRQHERRVEQMLEATTPRMHELLGLGQVTLP